MCEGVDSSEETTIQPSTSLQDQFCHLVWYVGFSCSGFDILKDPVAITFRNQLETENTILSKIHVSREDTSVSTVHLFSSKVFLERSVSSLVILQSHISIC